MEERMYYGYAIDPIHLGTGGYRLGEVDLTIIREPGTNLPKIPGSSLEGATRDYTAIKSGKYRHKPEDDRSSDVFLSCAGKGGDDGSLHCGKIDCPVCVTFGFTIGPENRSFHGMAQFYDAHILFFPVSTLYGPVWVTWPEALSRVGLTYEKEDGSEFIPEPAKVYVATDLNTKVTQSGIKTLNLGWANLPVTGTMSLAPENHQIIKMPGKKTTQILQNLVLISDEDAGIIVNDNLEVRTSVTIDPDTGAAKDKNLFTFEALPRDTVFSMPMVYLNPQHFAFPEKGEKAPTAFGEDISSEWVEEQVKKGMSLMPYMGIGGMNTRGFGRLKVYFEGDTLP